MGENYLMTSGFNNIIIGDNSLEALNCLLNGLKCSIVITDDVMSGFNGYQLIETMKNNEKLTHIPVILLGSRGEKTSWNNTKNLLIISDLEKKGMYFSRPLFLTNDLAIKVRKMLEKN